jgi:putative DNA primase/helicase
MNQQQEYEAKAAKLDAFNMPPAVTDLEYMADGYSAVPDYFNEGEFQLHIPSSEIIYHNQPKSEAVRKKDTSPLAPPIMPFSAFPGLIGDIVTVATQNSEAHPVAVAANVLALFCSAIGRVAYQRIGDATIHARPFFLVVGKSGKARKGTAEHTAREIFRRADIVLRARNNSKDKLRVHTGGLSTGEGIGYAIRDPREPDEKTGKGGDVGVEDKRIMVIESEFANVLAQIKREGNILSSTLRNLWDGRDIEPLTKSTLMAVTKPHVVVIGHITSGELREKSTANDAANGLLNRFMILQVYRPKLFALPEPTPDAVLDSFADRVADAIDQVTIGNPHACNKREVTLSDNAKDVWSEIYPRISLDREGKAGSLMARSEVYARLLAMIFALLDKRLIIESTDLLVALDWIDFWAASVQYVFLTGDATDELDSFAKEVLAVVANTPGVTLTDIQKVWSRNRCAQVNAALEVMLNSSPPVIEMRKDSSNSKNGRPTKRYYIAHV